MASETQSGETGKVGLALSGGGFRASIFHLGVIRRLEELGMMKDVAVISSVSGGSIIAAYYVVQMDRRLRERRREIEEKPETIDAVRLELFEEIAADFFAALDHNLRTRALIYSPFYHPIKWIKSLCPGYSRSDLIQKEYDGWFYDGNTLDQLPPVTRGDSQGPVSIVAGPKLILNTTSLMTGERIGFSRDPVSAFNELKGVNKNVLTLSRIVGASSCVPGLFPPVPVSGNLLVDGGVSDNQGIEGLLEEGCVVLLVSDASGQLEQMHTLSSRAINVVSRTTSILQFQVRKKLLDLLLSWKKGEGGRNFAFIHLFLNLKDRAEGARVPSEYIPGIARIRTDLDQFGFIEREALMYHGYTLINSQVARYCPEMMNGRGPELKRPPLFTDHPAVEEEGEEDDRESRFLQRRERIKKVLEIGSQKLFLLRSLQKYPAKAGAVILLTWLIPLVVIDWVEVNPHLDWLTERVVVPVLGWLQGMIPGWLTWIFTDFVGFLQWPITPEGVTVVVALLFLGYVLGFSTYLTMRRLVRKWDLNQYRRLTGGKEPSTSW